MSLWNPFEPSKKEKDAVRRQAPGPLSTKYNDAYRQREDAARRDFEARANQQRANNLIAERNANERRAAALYWEQGVDRALGKYGAQLYGSGSGGGYGRGGYGGYGRGGGGGGGGGGVDVLKLLTQARDAGKAGIEQVSNESILRIAALAAEASRRNSELGNAIRAPYDQARQMNDSSLAALQADLARQGAASSSLNLEAVARNAALADAMARQQTLQGQYGQQLEGSLAARRLASEQAKQNALTDLEKLYAAAKQRAGV